MKISQEQKINVKHLLVMMVIVGVIQMKMVFVEPEIVMIIQQQLQIMNVSNSNHGARPTGEDVLMI